MGKKINEPNLWISFKANQQKYECLDDIYEKLEYCVDSLQGWIVDKPARIDTLTAEINGEDVNIISLIQAVQKSVYQEMKRRQRENISISKKLNLTL